jgi:chloramphenicol 3-O phosphotransferase
MDAFVTMSNRRDMRSDVERDQAYALHCRNLASTLRQVAASHFDIVLDLVRVPASVLVEAGYFLSHTGRRRSRYPRAR